MAIRGNQRRPPTSIALRCLATAVFGSAVIGSPLLGPAPAQGTPAITVPSTLVGTITTTETVHYSADNVKSDDLSSTVVETVSLEPDPQRPGRFTDDGNSSWSATYRDTIVFSDGGVIAETGRGSGKYGQDHVQGFLEAFQPAVNYPNHVDWLDYPYHFVNVPTTSSSPSGTDQTTEYVKASDCSSAPVEESDVFVVTHPGPTETIAMNCSATYHRDHATDNVEVSGALHSGCSSTIDAGAEPGRISAETTSPTCLTISSPGRDVMIAMSDSKYFSPQPDLADTTQRAPKTRNLEVKGTDACGCPVSVNGVQAAVQGTSWTAKLPNLEPGKITLTAKVDKPGSAGQISEDITVVDLRVTSPSDGESRNMTAQPNPKLPDLDATVTVVGYPLSLAAVSFRWSLSVFGEYRTRKDKATRIGRWQAYEDVIATGSTTGSQPWVPHYTELAGGKAEILVHASIPGVIDGPTDSDPLWFGLLGDNAEPPAVLAYIARAAGSDAPYVQHIDCIESNRTYEQFRSVVDHREPADPALPTDIRGPFAWRPLYGADPAGIGIAQLDPADFPTRQWNWQTNVAGGIAVYRDAHMTSLRERSHEQATLDRQYRGALALVNLQRASRLLPPLSGDAATIPDMTANQHVRDAIRRYNSGKEYRYDLAYYPDFASLTVGALGSRTWVLNPNPNNAPYVTQVIACTAGGLQRLNLPVPVSAPATQHTTPGGPVVGAAAGFSPAENVSVTLHSRPVVLDSARASFDAGSVETVLRIPSDTPPGHHALVLRGHA